MARDNHICLEAFEEGGEYAQILSKTKKLNVTEESGG